MRKESTAQVFIPVIAFAFVLHLVFLHAFLADISTSWLLLVLTIQTVILALWAFEKVSAPAVKAGAAAAAMIIDIWAAVRSAMEAGDFVSPGFLGASLSILITAAALLAAYRLATTPGYWFTRRPQPAAGQSTVAAPPPPEDKEGGTNLFRIHHARTGELILTCPSEDIGNTLNTRVLRELLTDYDPGTLAIAQVTWSEDRALDVYVEGELKGSGSDHYKLLELEE